jgi:hypothetical protein
LKRNPADRYQLAQQVLDDISRTGQGSQPSTSRPFKPVWLLIPAAAVLFLLVGLVMFNALTSTTGSESTGNVSVQDTARNSNDRAASLAQAGELKQFQIDASEGPAKVFLNGAEVGITPYTVNGRPGDRVNLVLKREGFADKPVELTVSENPRPYTFTLSKLEAHQP